jgi:6-pyruvoyltetrahydropterin/6-carboxytetrahydropterin synthase
MLAGVQVKFDAAHHLPNYEGKCRNLHGHTWKVDVVISGLTNQNGFVIDFTILKRELAILIDKHFDHKNLNETFANPTCENIASFIFHYLYSKFPGLAIVEVKEGDGGYVVYSNADYIRDGE